MPPEINDDLANLTALFASFMALGILVTGFALGRRWLSKVESGSRDPEWLDRINDGSASQWPKVE